MGLTVAEIMSTELITVTPETGIRELAGILSRDNISGVPVLDANGQLVGVVSQSDLVAQNKNLHIPTAVTLFDWVIYLGGTDKFKTELNKIAGRSVGEIMSRKVITVAPEDPLEDVATIMTEKNVHTIPVVKDGKLVGLVGKLDIIRSLLR